MTTPFEWTDERVEELKKMWDTGLSASEIGRRLGITKNAVVGKVRRLDLPMRRAPAPVKIEVNVVTLDRLGTNMCSWPVGDPGSEDFRFCGEPAVPGKPYCQPHCKIAYVASTKNRKRDEAA